MRITAEFEIPKGKLLCQTVEADPEMMELTRGGIGMAYIYREMCREFIKAVHS